LFNSGPEEFPMTGHRKPVTFFIICLLLAMGLPGSSLVVAQDAQDTQDEEAVDEPLGWPRDLDTEKGVVTVYQPQIESFKGETLECRAAVSVQEKGKDDPPVFGAVWLKARMATDMDATPHALELTDLDSSEKKIKHRPCLSHADVTNDTVSTRLLFLSLSLFISLSSSLSPLLSLSLSLSLSLPPPSLPSRGD